jgi:MFS superfamily sulfate permease-like transporter
MLDARSVYSVSGQEIRCVDYKEKIRNLISTVLSLCFASASEGIYVGIFVSCTTVAT